MTTTPGPKPKGWRSHPLCPQRRKPSTGAVATVDQQRLLPARKRRWRDHRAVTPMRATMPPKPTA